MTLRTFTLYKSLLILCFVSISTIYFSQLSNFNSPKNWKKNVHELVLNVGTTAFLGELGGRDMVGTDYSLADLDLPSTSLNIGFSYRFRFHPYFATSSIVSIGQIKGDDALTLDPVRNARNLNFKSIIISAYQRIECLVYFRELFGHKYNFKNLKGKKNRNEQVYLFSGFGITYFNPQGNYNGTWTSLRPLRTEGQGFPDRPDEYLPITAIVPFGLGFRVGIDRMWRIGMEFTYFKTFTDYMDDVSTTGFDTDLLADKYGPEAAFLSNPAKTEEHKAWFGNGQQRGDAKQKDAYFFANVIVVRNITYKTKSPRRPTIKWKGMRAKF
jgi:hypothetical protein